jgi:CMP-N-acetylneuraminic acid synthetase
VWRRRLHTNIKVLGVIPARGGSKGVLRKNIRLLAGQPLISYAIESAKDSERLTSFMVSTDDEEVASVAKDFGADVLMRPAHLAEDATPMLPVMQHALVEAEKLHHLKYDYLMILQPTAPKRTAQDIDNSIAVIEKTGAESLTSLYRVEDSHPSRMYTLEGGKMVKVMEEPAGALRQALPEVFHRNGCIYLSSRELILDKAQILDDACVPYIMSEENSVNIDTELDLEYAEFIFQRNAKDDAKQS